MSSDIVKEPKQSHWLHAVCFAACVRSSVRLPADAVRKCPTPAVVFWKCYKTLTFWLTFGKVQNPLRVPRKITSEPSKVVRTWCALYILTWKCASHHNSIHFFNISTSKSAPSMVCFARFDLEMCSAPQRRALFRHVNFQKWSQHGVFCTV